MTAAALAFIFIGAGCIFAVRPALAADIPGINKIVYALSPAVEPSQEVQDNIAETIQGVLSQFISNATWKVGVRFKSGEDWELNEDTLLAAYYLHFEAASAELINAGKPFALANVAVKHVETEQKGFRYAATVTYDILVGGEYYVTETANAQLEESAKGIYITSLNIISEGFEAYKEYLAEYDRLEHSGGTLDENIATYNAFLIARQSALHELEQRQQAASGTEISRDEQLEELAAELCYRYWSATKEPDMRDIMERNDDTELWFLTVKIRAELFPPTRAQKGYADITEIINETDEQITALVYVKTIIDGGVGQTIRLTYRLTDGKYKIVAYFNPWDDGLDQNLQQYAEQYIKQGMRRSEANQKAYEKARAGVIERLKFLENLNNKA
ncbi:MAG: hypothetical protein VB051_09195 [Candidatus Pelethousia sp.]|nr:hypothetical protein [Candidatus Pelethousia sp.]